MKYQIEDLKLCLNLRSDMKMFSELGHLQKNLVCGKCDTKLILPQEFNALEPLTSDIESKSNFHGFSSCDKCRNSYKIEYWPTSEDLSNAITLGNGRKVLTKIILKDIHNWWLCTRHKNSQVV